MHQEPRLLSNHNFCCTGKSCLLLCLGTVLQIQADLGEGHINIVNAKEALLTEFHLALVLEYASAGTLTGYVAERWHHGQTHGLFLTEDEARYFFRVRASSSPFGTSSQRERQREREITSVPAT
jgi:hypothetical protein